MMTLKNTLMAAFLLSITSVSSVMAQSNNLNSYYSHVGYTQSDFGGVGLLQTPTARFADAGEFNFNYRDNEEYRRWSISLQPLEWLETTLRYTDTRTRLYSYSPEFSGDQTHKDKGFDIKLRLLKESELVPQTIFGMRDIAGTGNYDSEYFISSKRVGSLDFSLGMAWGYAGHRGNISNPFCKLKESYCERNIHFTGGNVGNFELGDSFKGPASIIGGVEYQTPINALKFKVEYEGNNYKDDFATEDGYIIKQDTPINVGMVYQVNDNLVTTISYERGNTLMWGVSFNTNFNKLQPAFFNEKSRAENINKEKDDWPLISNELHDKAGYKVNKIIDDGNGKTIYAEQDKYRDDNVATEYAVDILSKNSNEDDIVIIKQNKNITNKKEQLDLNRERHLTDDYFGVSDVKTASPDFSLSKKNKNSNELYKEDSDEFNFSVEPGLSQSIGGSENFYIYQVSAKGIADYNITNTLSVNSSANLNILNNYDKFNYKTPPADGYKLPRVRTWVREYVDSSDLLLSDLQLTYIDELNDSWATQIYAGYLELMFAGVGTEILYRPQGSEWAIGSNVNRVKQRDWNNTMQLSDYEVNTGHMTFYWDIPNSNRVLAKISIGKYLAGDKGLTLDLSKEFDSGIIAGAFATKTNVSASDYGEGSFTKGFYISIPLDLMVVHPTVKRSTISWVPLTRDGGQMLERRFSLYDLSR